MSRHQDLYMGNGIQSSRTGRLNRERVAIRAKERNNEFLSRRNISPSKSDEVTKEVNKENETTQKNHEVGGKSNSEKLTRQEQFLQRLREYKENKKQQIELKKNQRQQKPFVSAVCAVVGVKRNPPPTAVATATKAITEPAANFQKDGSENQAKRLTKRQSLYSFSVTPLRKKEEENGVNVKKAPVVFYKPKAQFNSIWDGKDGGKITSTNIVVVPTAETEVAPIKAAGGPAKTIVVPAKDIVAPVKVVAPSKAVVAPAKNIVASSKHIVAPAKDIVASSKNIVAPANDIAAPAKAVVAPPKAVVAPPKSTVAPVKAASAKFVITPAKTQVIPTKAKVVHAREVTATTKDVVALTNNPAIPVSTAVAVAVAASISAAVTASGTTRFAASTENKTKARIVKPIRGGGGIAAEKKPTFTRPLPPPPRPSVKTKNVPTKPHLQVGTRNTVDGASGKVKKQMDKKQAEELKKHSKLSVCMKAKKPNPSSTKTIKNITSKLNLNKKNLEVPHQGFPVAETPTDLTNINPFGFFVTSTKRKSSVANNFNIVRCSPRNEDIFKFVVDEEDENKTETCEISRTLLKPETPASVRETLKTIKNFRKQLADEIVRLHALCDKWELYKAQNISQIQENKDAIDLIDVTIGQTKLLTSKKFIQFSGLIDRCEKGVTSNDMVNDGSENTKPITPVDLDGFWSMLGLQVDNIDKRFENLERWRSNNWIEPDAVKSAIKHKTKNNPIKKAKNIIKPAKPSVALEQMMRKMHAAMRNNKAKTTSSASASGDKDIVLTPSSRRRRSKSGTPQQSSTPCRITKPRRISTPRRDSTPRRNSLIVKDKKFYSLAPTVLIKQSTPDRRNSLGKMDLKESPKQFSKLVNDLSNSLRKMEKRLSRNELLKSALKGAEMRRLSFAATPSRTKAKTSPSLLNTPLAAKSILKTPGTAKGKPKNVYFSEELSTKKFKFTIGCDESSDEELDGGKQRKSIRENGADNSGQRTYQLRGRKVLLRPSSEFVIPVKPT